MGDLTNALWGQGSPDSAFVSEPSLGDRIIESYKQDAKAVGALVGLYHPETPQEAAELRKRALSLGAFTAVSAATGGLAGAALKGMGTVLPSAVSTFAPEILGAAAGGAAGAAVEGQDPLSAALLSAPFGALGGGMATMGARAEARGALARAAEQQAVQQAREQAAAAVVARRTRVEELQRGFRTQQAAETASQVGQRLREEQLTARGNYQELQKMIEQRRAERTMGAAETEAAREMKGTLKGEIRLTDRQVAARAWAVDLKREQEDYRRAIALVQGKTPQEYAEHIADLQAQAVQRVGKMEPGFAALATMERKAAARKLGVPNTGEEMLTPYQEVGPQVMRDMQQTAAGTGAEAVAQAAAQDQQQLMRQFKEYVIGGQPARPRVARGVRRALKPTGFQALSRVEDELRTAPIAAATETAREVSDGAFSKAAQAVGGNPSLRGAGRFVLRAVMPGLSHIRRMGPVGQQLGKELEDWWANSLMRAGSDTEIALKAMRGIPNDQIENVAHVLEGHAAPVSPLVAQAAPTLRKLLDEYKNDLERYGTRMVIPETGDVVQFKGRPDYYPHWITEHSIKQTLEGPERAAALKRLRDAHLASSQREAEGLLLAMSQAPRDLDLRSRFYFPQFARELGMGGYDLNARRTLPEYFLRMSRQIEFAKQFGGQNERIVGMLNTMAEQGHDARTAYDIIRAVVGRSPRRYRALVSTLRTLTGVSFLSTAGLIQPAQTANTMAHFGYLNTLAGLGAIFNRAQRDEVLRAGVALGQTVQDLNPEKGDFLHFWTRMIGLQGLDKANRIVAAWAARRAAPQWAEQFAESQSPRLARRLMQVGLDPKQVLEQGGALTDQQLRRAMLFGSEKLTQFSTGALDLPAARNSDFGDMAYLFKSFALKQGEFTAGLLNQARRGDVAPLLRYLSGLASLGFITAESVRYLHGKEPPDEGQLRVWDNLATAGGMGIFADAWNSMDSGPERIASFIAGPSFGEFMKLAGYSADAIKGEPRQLAREMVRLVPLLGRNQAAVDYLVPPE